MTSLSSQPRSVSVSMDSFIEVYDGALSPELCGDAIAKFDASHSQQYAGVTGAGVDTSRKDSLDILLTGKPDWKPIHDAVLQSTMLCLKQYVQRYGFLLAGSLAPTVRDPRNGEEYNLNHETFDRLTPEQIDALLLHLYRPGPLVMQKYARGVGGYHHWHSEIYPSDHTCEALHRVLLFMFYLNGVELGGETAFYYQDTKVPPKCGRMVIAPAGFTHTHKGHVPKSEDKYIITSWILFQRAEKLFERSH